MPETAETEIMMEMRRTLDEIRALLVMINQDRLEEAKERLLPKDSIKNQIYDLSDGTRTSKDIADKISKSSDYVASYISILRREGLIRTVKRDGKLIHEQVF